MIWFFSGWGLITPILVLAGFVIGVMSMWALVQFAHIRVDPMLVSAAGWLVATILVWVVGRPLNARARAQGRRPHSFMFIPMQYYACILLAFFALAMLLAFFDTPPR